MPGFSIRKVQWGPPPFLAPVAPAHFISNQAKHRYVKNHTPNRIGLVKGSGATPETQAFIPYYLTHLRTNRRNVYPLAPPAIPSVQHLPYSVGSRVHKFLYGKARFFKLPKLEDPGPPATTRPIKFLTPGFREHRRQLSTGYGFGIVGGDAVGIPPARPKFGFLLGKVYRARRRTAYSFRTWFPKFFVVPATDKLYRTLTGLPKPHKYSRGFTRLKYTPKFSPTVTNRLSLIEFFNLRIRLDVKKAVDSGTVAANSGDVGGTTVNFNRTFKDVDSIVGTVQEVNDFTVVVDFVDIPNPTFFKVLVFDTAGTRVSKTVRWVARGII